MDRLRRTTKQCKHPPVFDDLTFSPSLPPSLKDHQAPPFTQWISTHLLLSILLLVRALPQCLFLAVIHRTPSCHEFKRLILLASQSINDTSSYVLCSCRIHQRTSSQFVAKAITPDRRIMHSRLEWIRCVTATYLPHCPNIHYGSNRRWIIITDRTK